MPVAINRVPHGRIEASDVNAIAVLLNAVETTAHAAASVAADALAAVGNISPVDLSALEDGLAAATATADSAIPSGEKGAANGVATLDGSGLVPDAQIPPTIARDTEVATAVAALVNSAPSTLDTLGELAAALQADEGAATTLTAQVALKAPLASPAFTGTPTKGGSPLLSQSDAAGAYASKVSAQRDRDALKQFRYKLASAKAGTGTCDILTIGDSKTEGNNATARTKRWQDVLLGLLRASWQPAGVTGGGPYQPALYTTGIPFTAPMTLAGGAITGGITSGGLGQHSVRLNGAGQTATFTVPAGYDAVDIFFLKTPAGGTFSWAVDGGAATNVGTANTPQKDGFTTRITGLNTGSARTITLTWVANSVFLHGFYAYQGDTTQGVRMWDDGQGGSTTSSWAGSTPGVNGLLNNQVGSIATIQPSLVLIDLMTNDFSAAAPAIAPATSQTNLAAMVDLVRAQCTVAPSIVLCVPFQRTGSFTYQWSDYVAAAEAVALAKGTAVWYGGKALFDAPVMPSGFSSDSIHPSDLGHQMWAEDLNRFLTRTLGTSDY